jgi:hypothetical protein
MADVGVEIEGLEELDNRMKRAIMAMDPAKIEQALLPVAKSFASKLRTILPQGPTGNLRRAVYAHTPRRGANRPLPAASAGITARIAPHLHLVEYGTTKRYAESGAYRGVMPRGMYFTNLAQRESSGMTQQVVAAMKALVDENL